MAACKGAWRGARISIRIRWRPLTRAIEQLLEHGLTPDLARADFRHHPLMHALDPSIHLTALAVTNTHPRLRRQCQ